METVNTLWVLETAKENGPLKFTCSLCMCTLFLDGIHQHVNGKQHERNHALLGKEGKTKFMEYIVPFRAARDDPNIMWKGTMDR